MLHILQKKKLKPKIVKNFTCVNDEIKNILSSNGLYNDERIAESYLCRLLTNLIFTLTCGLCHPQNRTSYKIRKKEFIALTSQPEYIYVFNKKFTQSRDHRSN